MPSPGAFPALWGLQGAPGAPDVAAGALLWEWVSTAEPMRTGTVPGWVARFRSMGGFVLGNAVTEHARPVRPLRLYRAAGVGHERGMSWTPFRLTAAMYATTLRGGCPVWVAEVEPAAMLAAFPGAIGHAWDEVVIDPAGVRPTLCRVPDRLWSTRAADRAALLAGRSDQDAPDGGHQSDC